MINQDFPKSTRAPQDNFERNIDKYEQRCFDAKQNPLCFLCNEEHFCADCFHYPSIEERMNRLQLIERCVHCTSMEHQDNCPSNVRCIFCEQDHHQLFCEKYLTYKFGNPDPVPHGIKEKFKKAFNKLHIYEDNYQNNQKTIRPAKTNRTSRPTKNKARQTAKTNVINSIKPALGNLIKAAPKAIKMLSQLHHNTTGPNGSNLVELENEQNSEGINDELEESQSQIDNFSGEEQEDEDYSDVDEDEDAQDEEQEVEDYFDDDEDEGAQDEENQSEYDSYPENNESENYEGDLATEGDQIYQDEYQDENESSYPENLESDQQTEQEYEFPPSYEPDS